MNQPVKPSVSEDCIVDEMLVAGSLGRCKIQGQLITALVGYLKNDFSSPDPQSEEDNLVAYFVLREISDHFAKWFDSLCSKKDDGGKMTKNQFMERYDASPHNVLQDFLSFYQYNQPQDYLVELWIKYNKTYNPDESQELSTASILSKRTTPELKVSENVDRLVKDVMAPTG